MLSPLVTSANLWQVPFMWFVLLFVFLPAIELFLLLRIGAMIGPGMTVGLIVLTGLLGAWLAKSQGRQAMSKVRQAIAAGQLPHREALNGALVVVAGIVLLTPGFLTDIIGFCLMMEPIRLAVGESLLKKFAGQVKFQSFGHPSSRSTSSRRDAEVIEAEVIENDDADKNRKLD